MVGETFDVDTDRNSKPHEEAEMYNVPGLSRTLVLFDAVPARRGQLVVCGMCVSFVQSSPV